MTTLLLLIALSTPAQPPAAAPEVDAKQLAAWVADLSAKDLNKQNAARDALVKAGPKAKALVPDLIKLVNDNGKQGNWAWSHAIEVLGAIGPDAKDAAPVLAALIKPSTTSNSGVLVDRIGVALAKIEGPKPETTRALLLSWSKGQPIVLLGSEYLRAYPAAVAGNLLELCKDKTPEVRQKAIIVLAGLPTWSNYGATKPLALQVGEAGKDAPALFEKMLADEDPAVRMTAAHGLSHIAPDQATKTIPAVIATMSDPKLKDKVGYVPAAEIFQPIPNEAAKALIPLFDGADHGRWWAIDTLAKMPVRTQLEETLKNGKTARTREAAVITIGSRTADGALSVPVLKGALDDREFTVRFAAAVAFVQIGVRRSGTAATGVDVLIEGLKQEDMVVRLAAAKNLRIIGARARAAVPELKRVLGDRKPEVALEAAQALVEISRTEAADAVPVLVGAVKSTDEPNATRAARALGELGPVAKAAVPELVKRFAAQALPVRIAAAEAAARIDPEQGEKATEVLLAVFKQHKGGLFHNEAVYSLTRIGPPAKTALPALLEAFNPSDKTLRYFRLELALAIMAIDPETAKPVVAWIRQSIAKDGGEDAYDIAQQVRELGADAKPLLAELITMLGSKEAYIRQCAMLTLGAIGPDAKDALPRLKELAEKEKSANLRKIAAGAIKDIEAK